MKTQLITYFIGVTVLVTSCIAPSQISDRHQENTLTDMEQVYKEAIIDASYMDSSEVYKNLWNISESNEQLRWKEIEGESYVLVVTWSEARYFGALKEDSLYNTKARDMWVTPAPELQERMKMLSFQDTSLRLKQLLGLPASSSYTHFIEFWVKPSQLFRPCFDEEIEDTTCDICPPSNIDTRHRQWLMNMRMSNYEAGGNLQQQYPWTQLGYTYDWNPSNPSHVGLSEYVILNNSKIKVHRITSTNAYIEE